MGSAARTSDEHRYQLCRDPYCDRFLCRVYKEGYRNGDYDGYRRGHDEGYAEGYSAGHADGYREGYAAGYAEGVANCPRAHS